MSNEALTWAKKVKTGNSSAKAVLLVIADSARAPEHLVFKRLDDIADETELDRKTVIQAMKRLLEMGIIEDTGMKAGRTGRTSVYRLTFKVPVLAESPRKRHSSNSPKNGTIKQYQKRDDSNSNSPENGTFNSPKNGTIHNNPSINPNNLPPCNPPTDHSEPEIELPPEHPPNPPPPKLDPGSEFDLLKSAPDGINFDAWADWVRFRGKRKKISETAARRQWKRLLRWSREEQAEIISRSIENDYQGLFDEFLEKRHAQANRGATQRGAGFGNISTFPSRASPIERRKAARAAAEDHAQSYRNAVGQNGGHVRAPLDGEFWRDD